MLGAAWPAPSTQHIAASAGMRTTHMLRTQSPLQASFSSAGSGPSFSSLSAHSIRALPSDLTWDVPPPLEEGYGLNLTDRDRLLLHQQQLEGHAPAQPMEGPSPPRSVAEMYRCARMWGVPGVLLWPARVHPAARCLCFAACVLACLRARMRCLCVRLAPGWLSSTPCTC